MLTLIENGEIFAPKPLGQASILIAAGRILKIGEIDFQSVQALGIEVDTIDAKNSLVMPGLIDPHEHLLGGSGEEGFATQTPEINAAEIVSAGITTVAGCLGVDTTMKTPAGLLAKVKALREEGLSAVMWTGGYDVPPTTITGSARNDIMFIREIIGAGEIAISDERSTDYQPPELARLVIDAHNGGMLARKAGVTHFHVGKDEKRLGPLRNLLENFPIKPEWLYPTHITRSRELMNEAIELARQGSFVDIDTVDEDLPEWFKFYDDHKGALEQLTISTDASIASPSNLLNQIRSCVLEAKIPLEQILPCVTANTAKVMQLRHKGGIEAGKDADILILGKKDLEIKTVIAGGKCLLKSGKLNFKEKFLEHSNRRIHLKGEKKK